MNDSSKINVLVADPDPRARAEMGTILNREADLKPIAEVSDGESLVDAVRRVAPDVVICAFSSNGRSSLVGARALVDSALPTKVLIVSLHNDSRYVVRALHAGASGYLLKDHASEELAKAVRTLVSDHIYISPGIAGTAETGTNRASDHQAHLYRRARSACA